MTAAGRRPLVDRLILGFLIALMALGCLALWTAVPGGALYLASLVDTSTTMHLLLAICTVPAAIIAAGAILIRLNALYLRVAVAAGLADPEFSRGPLETLIVASLAIAVMAMVAWMVFVAKDPFPWTPPAP
jgi:hypothetical protein